MEIIFILVSIIKSVAVGLGVGASTLAICSFFVAINDGQIDPSERRMLGVIYVVLRVAMVLILLSVLALFLLTSNVSLTAPAWAEWSMIAVLYLNALLMTKHIMPSKFGPAIQATTWYTLGVLASLAGLGLASFSYGAFLGYYVAAVIIAIVIVNSVMAYQKSRKQTS